jgi:cyclophilin family peptidyl-prolyl cis-trans isomerase
VLLVLWAGVCFRPVQAAESTAADYPALRSQWDELNGKLEALAGEFRAAEPAQRDEIRKQFGELVFQLNALLPRLRDSGIAAYKAAPNQDPKLVELLVGIVANDVRSDQYDAALTLAQLLIDQRCPEQAIYGLAGSAAYCRDDFELAEKYLQIARQANVLDDDSLVYQTDVALAKKLWTKEQALRQAEATAADLPRVQLKTTKGELVLELYENEAPQTVGNFISLVEKGFYNGLSFHRVLPGFMAQGGCPDGTGGGGPGYEVYCECQKPEHRNHFRGTLSMAHAGRDTGGSQFFLTFRRTSHLDGQHTVFGRVVEGLDVLAKLQRIDPEAARQVQPDKIVQAKVLRKREHEYAPSKVR